MALLLWFYISGIAILIGAEMNAEIEHASTNTARHRRDSTRPQSPMPRRHTTTSPERLRQRPTRVALTPSRGVDTASILTVLLQIAQSRARMVRAAAEEKLVSVWKPPP